VTVTEQHTDEPAGLRVTVDDAYSDPRFDTPEFDELANPMRALTKAERCDRCGAQAYVVSLHPAPTPAGTKKVALLWCKHHTERQIDALEPFIVRDERNTLKLED
jgi:hypothetical protein